MESIVLMLFYLRIAHAMFVFVSEIAATLVLICLRLIRSVIAQAAYAFASGEINIL
jgi:hypothetical protein